MTPIAGTTRDTVLSEIEIHGIPLTVVDTAGLRPTDDPIETLGIERTWAAIGRADVALVLIDAKAARRGHRARRRGDPRAAAGSACRGSSSTTRSISLALAPKSELAASGG